MPHANLKPESLRIVSTDNGLYLKDSILSFDAHDTSQLSFLSEAPGHSDKNFASQIITSEETIKVLEVFRRKPNALVCQYNRPFSIGQLKMELLPSGHALGGASLYLEIGSQSLLYAPHIQTQRIATHRQLQLKKAKILILAAHIPDPTFGVAKQRNREKELLLEAVNAHIQANKWPIIYCQMIPTAQEITQWLTSHGVSLATHPQIYKLNKVYEAYGSKLGNYSQLTARRGKNKVGLLALGPRRKLQAILDRPTILVGSHDEPIPPATASRVDKSFCLRACSGGSDYHEVIERVRPKEVYFFGPYAKEYSEVYKKAGTAGTVRPLYMNDQPPLLN